MDLKRLYQHSLRKKRVLIPALVAAVVCILLLVPVILHRSPSPPPGTNVATPPVTTDPAGVRLLIDDTAWDEDTGGRVIRQEIFDGMMEVISRADRFLYVDFFLWNPWQGGVPEDHRSLASELARALIEKKRKNRGMDILVMSDPINRIYGGHEPEFFKDMAKAGIPVVFTDLARLPDSNRLYAPYWLAAEKLMSASVLSPWAGRPRFSNPFDRGGPDISAVQLGRMLLFKANHRKVLIGGSSRYGLELVVGSLNPADGSSAHSNMALVVKGRPALDALEAEIRTLRWSLERKRNVIVGATGMASFKADSILREARRMADTGEGTPAGPTVSWLTEEAIADAVVDLLETAGAGQTIRIAMFYLSHRGTIEAIKGAAARGAAVRIILDANRDAFGMKKNGIPNRPVAAELMELSPRYDIEIRWADTHGEQFHTKAMSIMGPEGTDPVFITGSANWTRRNLGGLNLEADALVRGADGPADSFNRYFDAAFGNTGGLSRTLPFEAWEEKGLRRIVKTLMYRFQEEWGAGTF